MGESKFRDLLQRAQVTLILVLTGSVAWFVVKTILATGGRAPYSDIGDTTCRLVIRRRGSVLLYS